MLDAIANTLVNNPSVKKVHVVGGCEADEKDCDKLAMARANAVIGHLQSKGVAAARLQAKGPGERKWRTVELLIVRRE